MLKKRLWGVRNANSPHYNAALHIHNTEPYYWFLLIIYFISPRDTNLDEGIILMYQANSLLLGYLLFNIQKTWQGLYAMFSQQMDMINKEEYPLFKTLVRFVSIVVVLFLFILMFCLISAIHHSNLITVNIMFDMLTIFLKNMFSWGVIVTFCIYFFIVRYCIGITINRQLNIKRYKIHIP